MSGLFGGGGGHSLFGSGKGSAKNPQHHHGLLGSVVHGAGNFVGHLGKDVEQAAVGLPMGLTNLARHPIRSLEDVGKTTWQDWSPLFHGHVGTFAHNFYEHPLAPLLDIASIVTGGSALLGRSGAALAEVGVVSKESKLARLGAGYGKDASKVRDVAHHGEQGTVYSHRAANPATRGMQNIGHGVVNRVMPNWKGGEYERLVEKDTARRGVAVSHINADVHDAFKGVFHAGETLTHHPQEYFRVVDNTMHGNLTRFARSLDAKHAESMVKGEGVDTTFHAPKGVAFIRKDAPKTPGISSLEDVDQHLGSFGKRHTTKVGKAHDIVLDEHGRPLVVPDHNVNLLVQEAQNSTKLTRAIYHNPTRIWKWAVLTTPRFFVNNAIGNSLMAMVALNPISFTHGLLSAIKDTHGTRVATKAAGEFDKVTQKALGHQGDVVDKWYLGPHKEGFGYEASQSHQLYRKLEDAGRPNLAKVVKVGEQGLFNVTHRVAEKGIRRIGITEMLRSSPEVKAAMKGGHSFRDAVDKVSSNPAFRSRMQHQMDNILGQYHYYNDVEQQMRKIVPFYGWDRAIMRHARTMAVEKPGRTALGVGLGQQGVADTKKALGDIPSFLEGVLPLGGNKVLSTQGVNPYASVPDTINPILAAVGVGDHKPGEALATQLNPFIAGLIESTTGQSLLSGAKLPHHSGGIIGNVAATTAEGLPYTKLLETLLHGEQRPKANKRTGKTTPFLYRKDARTQIAALLGVPVKEINKERAGELARRARGETKGKKHGLFGR